MLAVQKKLIEDFHAINGDMSIQERARIMGIERTRYRRLVKGTAEMKLSEYLKMKKAVDQVLDLDFNREIGGIGENMRQDLSLVVKRMVKMKQLLAGKEE